MAIIAFCLTRNFFRRVDLFRNLIDFPTFYNFNFVNFYIIFFLVIFSTKSEGFHLSINAFFSNFTRVEITNNLNVENEKLTDAKALEFDENETEEDMTDEEKKNCVDLAKQFVEQQQYIDIALGGGYQHFCSEETDKKKCYRTDFDYRKQFQEDDNIEYIDTRDDLVSLTRAGTKSTYNFSIL